MIVRHIARELQEVAKEYKVVTVVGPRQSGKTTLVRMEFPHHHYVNLEEPDTRALAQRDPREFLKRHAPPVIIDEIQRVPMLLSYIQSEVDQREDKGAYILTGSHQPALKAEITQSLAGRTALLTLLPLSLAELQTAGLMMDRDECLYRGFMPQLYREKLNARRFYRNYYTTYVERDASQLINLRNFSAFELFIKLLAGRVGQLLNLSSLAGDVGVSSSTLVEWLSILEASYIVFRLPPYFANFGKRLIKTPKIYFYEVGLAASLLDLESPEMCARDPLMGNLFENMVVVEALKAQYNSGNEPNLFFLRDSNGVEVDLLQSKGRRLFPMEIKSARTYSPDFAAKIRKTQSWSSAIADGAVIYSGDQEQKFDHVRLVNFYHTAELITAMR